MKTIATILAISIVFSGWAFTPKYSELKNSNFTIIQKENFSFSPYKKKRKSNHKRRKSHGRSSSFGIAPNLSYLKPFRLKSTIGFGAQAYYAISDKNVIDLGLDFFLPTTSSYSDYATAGSSLVEPNQVSVTVTTKINVMLLKVGVMRYFAGEFSDDGFKFYGQAGAGIMNFKGKSTVSDYDHSKYQKYMKESESNPGLIIYLGLGLEQSIGSKGALFCDFKLNLPATEANGVAIEVTIPASLQASIGYKIMF